MVFTQYSPVEHLAKIVWPHPTNWKRVLFVMLTAYFDASGDKGDQPHLTVAGWAGFADTWIGFEQEWREALEKYHVPYFRMSDFVHSWGHFTSWKRRQPKREEFERHLMTIIKKHGPRKLGCTVYNDSLNNYLRKESRDEHLLEAYVIGARTCIKDMRDWMRWEHIDSPFECVFEDGDLDRGKLVERFEADKLPTPIFKPKKDTIRHGIFVPACLPLQAADFLAYELFQLAKGDRTEEDWWWGANEFMGMLGPVGVYKDGELGRMQNKIDKMDL